MPHALRNMIVHGNIIHYSYIVFTEYVRKLLGLMGRGRCEEAEVRLQWTPSPLKSLWMCLGRSLRGSLWKEAEVLHRGSGLGALVCVVS